MRYRKKPVIIEACQWFKNGDHYAVRDFRPDQFDRQSKCSRCAFIWAHHGYVDTLEGGHRVCPGDWIIKGIQGEHYPCKPDIFQKTYESAE